MDSQQAIKATCDGVSLTLAISPRAGRDEVVGLAGDSVKIRLKAPPVEGRANEALVSFLAKWLDVPRSSVEIISGATSRHKVVYVAGLTVAAVARRLSTPTGS